MSAATQKANEPSMEEILASIRRIIADDSSAPPPPPEDDPPAAAAVAEAEDLDVLDLATVPEAVATPIPPVELEPLPQSVEMDEDIEFRFIEEEPPPALLKVKAPEKAPAPPPPEPPPAIEMPLPEPEPAQPLIAEDVGAQVSNSFQFLATTLVPQNGRTLEDIVKDMMRPMLKSWLDQHLPGLVERLVKAEIERVTRGQR